MATVERNNSSRTRIREGGHLPRAVGGGKKKSTDHKQQTGQHANKRREKTQRNDMQLWHLSTFGVEGRGSKEK